MTGKQIGNLTVWQNLYLQGMSSPQEYVRGYICRECNLGLGHFMDSADNLTSAIRYLEAPRVKENRQSPVL